jgi:hypothetical protein
LKNLILCAALLVAACAAPRTERLHITYDGESAIQAAQLTPMQQQIDAAAVAASLMVGVDPAKVPFDTWVVMFHAGPIEWDGKQYWGLSHPGYSRVMYTPHCLFAPQSSLLHEFVHQMLGVRYGDMDPNHIAAVWQLVGPVKGMLMQEYCPDYLTEFMPEGSELPAGRR